MFAGDGTQCFEGAICTFDRIPAVSEWGLVVIILLVLAAGTVVIKRARAVTV